MTRNRHKGKKVAKGNAPAKKKVAAKATVSEAMSGKEQARVSAAIELSEDEIEVKALKAKVRELEKGKQQGNDTLKDMMTKLTERDAKITQLEYDLEVATAEVDSRRDFPQLWQPKDEDGKLAGFFAVHRLPGRTVCRAFNIVDTFGSDGPEQSVRKLTALPDTEFPWTGYRVIDLGDGIRITPLD